MKKTTNINQERSEKYRYLEKLNYVPKFIIISSCCGFLAGVALVLSVLGLFSSTSSSAKVNYELPKMQDEIDLSVKRTDLYIVYVQDLQAELRAKGFEVPPLPED